MARPDLPLQVSKTGRSRLAESWRDLRIGAGLEGKQLAEALACSASHISNIEQGRKVPSFELLARYEELVGSDGILRSLWEWATIERAEESVGPSSPPARRTASSGDRAQFVEDVAPLGKRVFHPLERFEAGWRIRNVGKVVWKNRYLKQAGPMSPRYAPLSLEPRVPIRETKPTETVTIKVPMMASQLPGESITYFHMVHADDALCFSDRYADGVYVRIRVTEPIRFR
jgi:transcriptional regulator with XRE-family HTH domain